MLPVLSCLHCYVFAPMMLVLCCLFGFKQSYALSSLYWMIGCLLVCFHAVVDLHAPRRSGRGETPGVPALPFQIGAPSPPQRRLCSLLSWGAVVYADMYMYVYIMLFVILLYIYILYLYMCVYISIHMSPFYL